MSKPNQPLFDIPKELTYEAITAFCPSTKVEARQTPLNAAGTLVPGTVMSVLIGEKMRSFANPATLVLKFVVAYNVNASPNSVKSYILGGGFGHFKDLAVRAVQGSGSVESIQNHNVLTNLIYSTTLNPVDKCSMINLGYDDSNGLNNSHIGLVIPSATTATTVYRSYSIPLLCALNTDKLIPLGCGDIQLDFTINFPTNFIAAISGAEVPIKSFTISEVELVYDVIELQDPFYTQLLNAHTNFQNQIELTIKSNVYQYGAGGTLGTGTSGYQEIPVTHKVNSMKQILWTCVPSDAWEKDYSGVNPNLLDWSMQINNTSYPQKPVPVRFVSEAYYQNLKSFGSVYTSSHSGNCRRDTFAKACIAANDATNLSVREYAPYTKAPTTDASIIANSNLVSNKFIQVLDLEKLNQLKTGSYSGISTYGGQNTIRLNIGKELESTTAGATFKIQYWTISDCTLSFNFTTKQLTIST